MAASVVGVQAQFMLSAHMSIWAFGPATLQDFAYWSGLTVSEARIAAGNLGKGLVEVAWEGRKGLICEEDVPVLQRTPEVEFDDPGLLPQFDVYLAGHCDKTQIVAGSKYKEVFRKAGWGSAVVLQGGKVTGIWAYRRSGSKLFVAADMFGKASAKLREAIACRCESLARFLGCSLTDVRFEDPDPV